MRQLKPLILLVIVILAVTMWNRRAATPDVAAPNSSHVGADVTPLPAQARAMLQQINRGGPFEHSQDGAVFGNYEGLLPKQPRGYYHEYTVATPGARNRGARRIITGGTPPAVWYYTDDHYRSFRRFEVAR
jgi:ribonuclease T1